MRRTAPTYSPRSTNGYPQCCLPVAARSKLHFGTSDGPWELLRINSLALRMCHLRPSIAAETDADQLEFRELEHLAFVLGLDPAKLSVDSHAGADSNLGVRLRVLENAHASPGAARLTQQSELRFCEAASIIRSQRQLQRWLGKPEGAAEFMPSSDFGPPAFRAGCELAEQARHRLGIGLEPIESMRHLIESRLGIPIVQVELPAPIAGATISSHGQLGIVLNVQGANSNVWIRCATLAHELAHILFDPEEHLASVCVDRYDEVARDALDDTRSPDVVEQRANAFAVEFLAPRDAVKQLVPSVAQVSAANIATVMSVFGIGKAAARFHVGNSWWGQAVLPPESAIWATPRRRATGGGRLHAGLLPA